MSQAAVAGPNLITVIITAGQKSANFNPPTFGPNRANTITLSGYQVSATITCASGLSQTAAEISIGNLDLPTMSALATLGVPLYALNQNKVTVLAGTDALGMTPVFEGNIATAYASFQNSPDSQFNITAYSSLDASLTPVPPTSFSGAVNVATLMEQLATLAGYSFENNGVSEVLSNPYLPGTAWDQIKSVATAASIEYAVSNNTLAIWPRGGYRNSLAVPVISASTGLVGYPEFSMFGLNFRTLFNPQLQYGSLVQIDSILKPACGKWQVYNLTHSLECQVPDGDWFSDVQAQVPGGLLIASY